MTLSEREVGELTAEVRNLKSEFIAVRHQLSRLNDRLDKRYVTRMEFRVVGIILGVATTLLGWLAAFKGR